MLIYLSRLPDRFESPRVLVGFLDNHPKAKRYFTATLANYIHYAEFQGEDYQQYRKVLKFERTRPDLNIPSDQKIISVIESLQSHYKTLALLLAYSGLRLIEAQTLVRGFDQDKVIVRGNVSAYPLGLLRNNKNAFYAFMPIWLADQLPGLSLVKYEGIRTKFKRVNLTVKYFRKWQYNALVRGGVDMLLAEFIQGRTFKIVGGTNYLGAFERAAEAYAKALPFIEGLLRAE